MAYQGDFQDVDILRLRVQLLVTGMRIQQHIMCIIIGFIIVFFPVTFILLNFYAEFVSAFVVFNFAFLVKDSEMNS